MNSAGVEFDFTAFSILRNEERSDFTLTAAFLRRPLVIRHAKDLSPPISRSLVEAFNHS